MDNIVIEEKQSKLLTLNFMGVLVTIICLVLFILGIRFHDILTRIAGLLGFFFFGICTLYSLRRIVKPRALLTITHDGIEDSSSAGAVGYISFHEIEHFEIVNIFGQRMIGVIPRNEDEFLAKLSPIKQRAAKSNLKMKLPPVAIRVDTARDITIEDILTLLDKRLSDYSSLYN